MSGCSADDAPTASLSSWSARAEFADFTTMSEGSMKRNNRNDTRPEYDFSSMKGGVRGKYVLRYRAGTNPVLLDPEVARAFPTDAAVNQTLRAVLDMANEVRLSSRARTAGSRRRRTRNTPA